MDSNQWRGNKEGLPASASPPLLAQSGQSATPEKAETQTAFSLRPQWFDDELWGLQGERVLELSTASHEPPQAQHEELGQ